MKEVRTLLVTLAAAIGLMAAGSGVAQTPIPNPPTKRGIGIEADSKTDPQNDQSKAREAKPELIMQTGYNNFFGATRLVFSPDGRLLATGTYRSTTVKLWETATGRELRNLSISGQVGIGMSPVFTFSADSRLIAAATGNEVRIWDVQSGRELQTLSGGQTSFMAALGTSFLGFSGDSKRLVTVSDAIRVYDVATWRELNTIDSGGADLSGLTGGESGMTVNSDGTQLACVRTDSGDAAVKILDLSSGREVRSMKLADEQPGNVELSFTTDGRLVAAGIIDKQLKFWDLTAKTAARDLAKTTDDYSPVRLSRNGRLVALSENYSVRIWDVTAGTELPALKVPNIGIFTQRAGVYVTFSSDGKKAATGGFGTQPTLWEVDTGKQLMQMKGRSNMAFAVAFSADGTQLSTGGRTRWDLRTGRGLRVIAAPSDRFFNLPSPSGKYVAQFTPSSSTVVILEATTGKPLQTLAPANPGKATVQRAFFSPDGRLLLTTYMDISGEVDNSANDKAMKDAMRAKDPAAAQQVLQNQMNQNASQIENQVKIWDVASGKELHSLPVGSAPNELGFSPDGRVVAILQSKGTSLWDLETGNKLRDLSASNTPNPTSPFGNLGGVAPIGTPMPMPGKLPKGMPSIPNMPNMADLNTMVTNAMGAMTAGTMGQNITSVAFSPDGRTVATGGVESKSNLDLNAMISGQTSNRKGQKNPPPSNPQDLMKNVRFETTGQIIFYDAGTGKEVGAIKGHGKGVTDVAFSHDGRLIASAASDNTIKIWDAATRRELRTLKGHNADIESMDFSPDGKLLASAGGDGGTFLWDVNTGEHLLTLVSLDDGGEWMVVTPEGLFDGTPVSWNQILWRYDHDTFNVAPIEWFFTEFYYPGLLADVFAGKRPHVALDVSRKDRRQPTVKLTVPGDPGGNPIGARTVRLKIDIADAAADKDHPQSSGARDLRLFRNGSLIKVWHGDVLKGQAATSIEEEITLVAGANRLTAYAFNKDNVKSKDATLALTGADSLKRAGTAWVIAVGVNEYANNQYNLKYAVADAQDFAEELRRRQSQVGRFENVEVVSLINQNATKANILAALQRLSGASTEAPTLKAGPLDRLKRAEPEDAVVIYFAGHGTAQGQRFYLLPHDLGYTGDRGALNEAGLQTILAHSISDLELEEAVESLASGSLLMVIDACNSGQALEAEEKRRGPMNSKGLAQLAYEKGMYILTAAQSYQAALEAAQLGHGLLTYALVEEGLKTSIADTQPKDGVLSAREWLDFATERVPLMQEEKMKEGRGLGLQIAFTEGEQKIADPEKRSVQRPRVFYRREMEASPLVIAKPGQ